VACLFHGDQRVALQNRFVEALGPKRIRHPYQEQNAEGNPYGSNDFSDTRHKDLGQDVVRHSRILLTIPYICWSVGRVGIIR